MYHYPKILISLLALGLATVYTHSSHAIKPKDVLANGVDSAMINGTEVRKGTLAALFHNLKALETLLEKDPKSSEIAGLKEDIRTTMPALKALGFFDIFPVNEWLFAKKANGKIWQSKVLLAALYLQAYPQELDNKLRQKIAQLKNQSLPPIQSELARITDS